jgi:hypothetical protein
MAIVATKIGRIRDGRVVGADARIMVARSSSGVGPDQVVWVALDSLRYEVRFERSPFNAQGAPEVIPAGAIKTVSDQVEPREYKYTVYTDGKPTDDPDVVVV